jgi:hypothetical protein
LATFYFGQSDTSPVLQDTLLDSSGAAVDLTGATVKFTMTDRFGVVVINAAAATIVGPPTGGVVSYTWQTADLANPGFYRGKWTVTFSGGGVESFPNADGSGTFLIVVTPKNK